MILLRRSVVLSTFTELWSGMLVSSCKHTYHGHIWGFRWKSSLKKCHLNCFIDKNVDTNYGEVHDENYGGPLFPIRFAQKSRWTLISPDSYYMQPKCRHQIVTTHITWSSMKFWARNFTNINLLALTSRWTVITRTLLLKRCVHSNYHHVSHK